MSYPTTAFEILISSPSDVTDARNVVEAVISDWNVAHSKRNRLTLVPVRWETHAVPEAGADPQSILNRQLVARCDLLVAVFGGRLGTATPRAPSGTAEEIEEFLQSGKPVMLHVVREGRTSADPQQLAALDEYLAKLRQRAFIPELETVANLQREFSRHLPQRVEPFLQSTEDTVAPAVLDETLLKTLVLLFESDGSALMEDVADRLNVRIPTAEFHLERLNAAGLVHRNATTFDGTFYELTTEGESELYSRGLLT
jgi:DNA-binding MarR family transcriptional regulator